MPTLYITRGLPGAGKSTWATAWVAEDPKWRVRVNRDDLRSMLHGGQWLPGVTEDRVIAVRDAAVLGLLERGVDVVVDDTNLPLRVVRDLATIAARACADFQVRDFTGVPLEECIARDAARPEPVGEENIRRLHDRYLTGGPLRVPVMPSADGSVYEPRPGTPRAVLVDVDGTVALMNGRSPYDETRVAFDLPHQPVIELVRALHAAGHRVVVVSGRTQAWRDATTAWLHKHLQVPFDGPFMRPVGDRREDWVVKLELFNAHIRDHYDVRAVLDDRTQVVRMWRSLGLPTFQVAEGMF